MDRDRSPLTRSRIAAAAVRLLNEAGEAGFTMRDLARGLGVDPMAIYHHLPNKAAVILAATEHVLAECPLPDRGLPWREQVRRLCRSLRELARCHPGVFPHVCVRQEFVESDFVIQEVLLDAISSAGLNDQQTVYAASALVGYTAGFALEELTGTLRPFNEDERARLLALPHGAFPATARLANAILDCDLDAEFNFGLDVIIAGIETLSRR